MSRASSESDTVAELHRLAHDLRNALSSIYSYSQLLQLALSKKGMSEEEKIAGSIRKAAKKMDAMITERVNRFITSLDTK